MAPLECTHRNFSFLFQFYLSSNCVVNLTADKKVVLKEAYRVLKVRNTSGIMFTTIGSMLGSGSLVLCILKLWLVSLSVLGQISYFHTAFLLRKVTLVQSNVHPEGS